MKTNEKAVSNGDIAIRVSTLTVIINTLLSAAKFFAGIFYKSSAMISDSIHSFSDVISTFVVIIGVKMSQKSADSDHQYGHERMECIASVVLALGLLAIGIGIGFKGIERVFFLDKAEIEVPGTGALVMAVISIVTKEVMFRYTKNASKKINSSALLADAWHHRSDAFSSIGAFFGILVSRMGYPQFDSVASIIICLFIVKVSMDIFRDSVDKLVDKACDDETVDIIRKTTEEVEGVKRIDKIRTRIFGSKIYVDVEISADGKITLNESHLIAQTVHDRIESVNPLIKHCMVHVNPISSVEIENR